jgi:hypothetical protein
MKSIERLLAAAQRSDVSALDGRRNDSAQWAHQVR